MSIGKKVFHIWKYAAAFLLLLVLLSYLDFTPNLLNAGYKIQRLLNEFGLSYYKYRYAKSADADPAALRDREHDLITKFSRIEKNRYFKAVRDFDPQIDSSLDKISGSLTASIESGDESSHKIITQELDLLYNKINIQIERQKLTIEFGLYAVLLSLLLTGMLTFYLYSKNRNNVASLEKALKDREYLIKEVHHRVKNNLAMVASLINIKSYELPDPSLLDDIKTQISSIGIIHENLYNGNSIEKIDFREYAEKLLGNVFRSISLFQVKVEIEADEEALPPKKMLPIGLIITELATNAIKHGFLQEGEQIFRIEFLKEEERHSYCLHVSNTGRKFPDDVSLTEGTSMGLELIRILVGQLQGEIHLERRPKTRFTIRFPSSE